MGDEFLMDRKSAIIAVLSFLLLISTMASYDLYQQQQHTIEAQEEIIESLISTPNTESVSADGAENPASISVSEGVNSANIVAVRSDTHSGVIGKVLVKITEGTGNVLVNTDPFVEPATQYSIREAVKVAENFTNMDIANNDLIISFEINGTLIGGPSAGAATTTATIAAMEGKQVREDAAITGTIEEGGYIGPVGGVFEKTIAAEQNGMVLFLVPSGQKKVIYYGREIEKQEIFGFTYTRVYYVPKEIDLGEYMAGKMAVEEVSTIDEVVAYMIV